MTLCPTKEYSKIEKSLIDDWCIEIKDFGRDQKLFLKNVPPKVDVDFVMYSYKEKTKKFDGLLKRYLYKTKDLPVKPCKTGFKIKAGVWFISFFVVPEFKKSGSITFTSTNQGIKSKSFILDEDFQSGEFKVSVLKDTIITVNLTEGLGLKNFENYIRFGKTPATQKQC